MYVCNVDEASVITGNKYVDLVKSSVADENAEVLIISAKIESEIAELEAEKAKLKGQGSGDIKKDFRDIFGTDASADIKGKFTRNQIIILRLKIKEIEKKESPLEQFFVDAKKKLDDLESELAPHGAKISF